MQIKNIDKIISSENFPPIIILFGEEEFLINETLDKILKVLIKDMSDEYNFDQLDGNEVKLSTLVDICNSYPMMSDRRVVIVKDFGKLFPGRGSKKEPDNSSFAKFLNSPQESTYLILTASISSLNGISKKFASNPETAKKKISSAKFPYNILLSKYHWMEFPKLYESEFPKWITSRIKAMGKRISIEAAQLLASRSEQNLRDISNEIEKLIIYTEARDSIDIADVTSLSGANRDYNVFELQKAVGKRSLGSSLKILFNMLDADKQEILIVTMLTRYFTILWKLIEESRHTSNDYQLASKIGVSPFFVPEYKAALRNYTTNEIDSAFLALTDADLKLKTSSGSTLAIMQNLLIEIIDRGS